MLPRLKRALGITDDVSVDAAAFDDIKAKLEIATEELATKANLITELSQKINDREAALADSIEAFQKLSGEFDAFKQERLQEKLTARKSLIVDAVGTARADAIFDMSKEMDDKSFGVMLNAVATSMKQESDSEMFKEVGVAGEVAASAEEESLEMKLLKAEYGSTGKKENK